MDWSDYEVDGQLSMFDIANDEEFECFVCEVNLDEDEYLKFLQGANFNCPYYNYYDEYKIVRKQN